MISGLFVVATRETHDGDRSRCKTNWLANKMTRTNKTQLDACFRSATGLVGWDIEVRRIHTEGRLFPLTKPSRLLPKLAHLGINRLGRSAWEPSGNGCGARYQQHLIHLSVLNKTAEHTWQVAENSPL
jgi:hypothetical protein